MDDCSKDLYRPTKIRLGSPFEYCWNLLEDLFLHSDSSCMFIDLFKASMCLWIETWKTPHISFSVYSWIWTIFPYQFVMRFVASSHGFRAHRIGLFLELVFFLPTQEYLQIRMWYAGQVEDWHVHCTPCCMIIGCGRGHDHAHSYYGEWSVVKHIVYA